MYNKSNIFIGKFISALKIKHHIFKYSQLANEIQIIDKFYIYLMDGSYLHFPAAIKSGS